ncbi:macro domain-containing protein [Methyloradius palustris]|uniref:Thoeris protein ThsA Macro domain-containing protein n=1 Tax=Methyloradius palustris TaxID=2778876 RepID=A0A8D5GD07_9PROT|nr:macro domain-containing protein [Methyloradius palustris]BCM25203.1 hypothetical protein ZMTM_14620 [Methyloradius palustris]
MKNIKYFFNTVFSKAYWQYIFISRAGIESILAIYGGIYLIAESLDFFSIYTKDKYGAYAFVIFFILSVVISILIRRPIKSILLEFKSIDINLEVRIDDLFEVSGAVMVSTNTIFEADVAGGKIAHNSLQGQFTSKYFTGNQNELINKINYELNKLQLSKPYPMGTTITINTHGKAFYLNAMSELNSQGNASTTLDDIEQALAGLWKHVRDEGELQELVLPVIGTGRGRINQSRKKIISIMAESFIKTSILGKFTGKLIIVIRSEDADNFKVNLYDIKDHLNQVLDSYI